jgi:hypothetical protein
MTTRAERKQARRELATWMREHGLAPTGAAWHAAADDGCRDVDALRVLAARDGATAKRLPDGRLLPAGLREGDTLADGARVICPPVLDPDTGAVWLTVRAPAPHGTTGQGDTGQGDTGRTEDRAMPAGEPVPGVTRSPRTAPAWVQAAAADYRDARDAHAAWRESGAPVPSSVPGTAGSGAAAYQLEDADVATYAPPPRFRDYLAEHAARMREPATAR